MAGWDLLGEGLLPGAVAGLRGRGSYLGKQRSVTGMGFSGDVAWGTRGWLRSFHRRDGDGFGVFLPTFYGVGMDRSLRGVIKCCTCGTEVVGM